MPKQTVRLTFGNWDYRGTSNVVIVGNVLGLGVIQAALENFYDNLPEDVFGKKYLVLVNDAGDELICDAGIYEGNFFEELLIAAEIIDIQPETDEAGK
jgi:hypothetical protein